MVVLRRKEPDKIKNFFKDPKNILIVGCEGCASVCFSGGRRQVEEFCLIVQNLIEKGQEVKGICPKRQCEIEYLKEYTQDFEWADSIFSLGCGVGTQMIAGVWLKKIYPLVDTLFVGSADADNAFLFSEYCGCCGDCKLDIYAGICPIRRCSKNLLNGPCGGSQEGLCELKTQDCAWELIYKRLKALGQEINLQEIVIPNWFESWEFKGKRKFEL